VNPSPLELKFIELLKAEHVPGPFASLPPMEFQLLHTLDDATKSLEPSFVVLAVLCELSVTSNSALAKLIKALQLHRNEKTYAHSEDRVVNVNVSLSELLSDYTGASLDVARYWSYAGALHVPPFTEGVQWFVLHQGIACSPADVAALSQLMNSTASAQLATISDVLVDGGGVDGGTAAAPNLQWSYDDMDTWNRRSATCLSGTHQSPIDLPAFAADNSLHPLSTAFKEAAKATWTVNNGIGWTTVQDAGGLRSWWSLRCVLLHMGSEHTLQGRRFAFELHFIHEYSGGGLWPRYLVIAVWGELGSVSEDCLASLLVKLERGAAQASPLVDLSGTFNAAEIFDRLPSDEYFNYRGSLTSPPCAEGVEWVIMHTTIGVTNADLDRFASLGLREAFRGTQSLNDRLIEGSQQSDTHSCAFSETDACGCCPDEGYVPNTYSLTSDAVTGNCMLGAHTSVREAAWCTSKTKNVRQRFIGAPEEGRQWSCACYHDNFCCLNWDLECQACADGSGNRFGCPVGGCPTGTESPCVCQLNPLCCSQWGAECQQCWESSGNIPMGNGATCTPGVCANGQSRERSAYLQGWDYSALETWSKAARVCVNGKQQSPVQLPKAGGPRKLPLKLLQSGFTMRNSGKGIKLMIKHNHGSTLWDMPLTEIHLHVPAEHQVDGSEHYPLEMQLVHNDRDDPFSTLHIVSILFKRASGQSNPNAALAKLCSLLPNSSSWDEIRKRRPS
jgi:carbonic anhydrase